MSALEWYGPLIDVCECASHIGHYVQLIVFVHMTRPIQKFKSSREGALLRTDVQVGDDTHSYFPLTIWKKEMGLMIVPGDVVLVQNVKIVKFGNTIEAGTVHFSSLVPLVHPYEVLMVEGVSDLLSRCQVGKTTKEKLKKVIEWVQKVRATLHSVQEHTYQKRKVFKNWKPYEEKRHHDCTSISEVSRLTISCNASFYALVGEIFLPSIGGSNGDFDKEMMFISRRQILMRDHGLAEDLICLGCKLCGYPMNLDSGYSLEQNTFPLYCQKSSNKLHIVCRIYRPFLLYVWDNSESIPLHVTNMGAELLFGNITAEKIYFRYEEEKNDLNSDQKDDHVTCHCDQRASASTKVLGVEVGGSQSLDVNERLPAKRIQRVDKKRSPNFYRIWLILLEVLVQQRKNSCLKFEVTVNTNLNQENGRFDLVSVTMPCTIPDHH